MSKTAARLTRAEQASYQRILNELAQRRGVLRFVVFARDAEPDPDYPGYWRSATADMITNLPLELNERALDAIGFLWTIEPEPDNDDEGTELNGWNG